jgi:hypothetical protein
VRLTLKVIIENDRDFVDVTLLYPLWGNAYKKRDLKMQKRK